ncbi:13354_t:CDS:2 [Ambispora gerdemannii]|uniref:Dihydropteridine reductase n=1 Tax=Ambispora gerdemannii TaxID=144530 RepID=A0A9N9G082_9GLOM|nr:13354_t:CDS:2 [Ambispora gerdemannii]
MTSKVLVYGGSGALGNGVVSLFCSHGWVVTSVGTRPNNQATHNIVVSLNTSLEQQGEQVLRETNEYLKGEKYAAILCVAGGFAMGNAAHKDFLKNSELMLKKTVWSSLISAKLAAHHLQENGLLTVAGVAGLHATPAFIGYGVAKAGAHQLVHSLASPKSGLPANTKVVGLLPKMIDTQSAREASPDSDFSSHTPIETLAQRLYNWTTGKIPVPHGKLVEVVTTKGETSFNEV